MTTFEITFDEAEDMLLTLRKARHATANETSGMTAQDMRRLLRLEEILSHGHRVNIEGEKQ